MRNKQTINSCGRLRPWIAALFIFLALAFFDVLIGGALSTILRLAGWTPLDQRVNDIYHVNYAVVVATALIWHYTHFKHLAPVLAVALLFCGYVEDTLFYFLVPLFNPAIKFLTKGETLQMASGQFLPEQISGWLGWLGRAFLSRNIVLDLSALFALNAIAMLIAILLFGKSIRLMPMSSKPSARK